MKFSDLCVDAHNKYSNDLVLFLSSSFELSLSANRQIISIRYIFSKINNLIRSLNPQASINRATKIKGRITTNKKVLYSWSSICERSRLLPALIVRKIYTKTIVGILYSLPIASLRSLENLIFSPDSLQSRAVRASKKRYVSVVSGEIAYRSHWELPHAYDSRVSFFPFKSLIDETRASNSTLDRHLHNR